MSQRYKLATLRNVYNLRVRITQSPVSYVRILITGTTPSRQVSVTHRPLYPRKENPSYLFNRKLLGPRSWSEIVGTRRRRKNTLTPARKQTTIRCPASSLVTISCVSSVSYTGLVKTSWN